MGKKKRWLVVTGTLVCCLLLVLVLLHCQNGAWYQATRTSRPKQEQKIKKPPATPKTAAQAAKEQRLAKLWQQGKDAFMAHRYQEALQAEEQVLKEDPDYYPAYSVKGITLCYAGNYQEGMAAIDRALALKPDYGYGRFNKALAYELYGHFDEALDWYHRTLTIGDNNLWSYYGIASIYGRRGDVANTVSYLKRAIELDPSVKENARSEKDFNNVRNSKEFQELIK